jgi:mono/diheme cytochrome c family protein
MASRRLVRRAGLVSSGLVLAVAWGTALSLRASAAEVPIGPAQESDQAPLTPDQLAREVFQIVQKNCLECHGEAKEGGLDLRTEAGLQKGGRTGRAVVAHQPGQSLLYKALMHEGDLRAEAVRGHAAHDPAVD